MGRELNALACKGLTSLGFSLAKTLVLATTRQGAHLVPKAEIKLQL